ncbi:MAG TPA: acyltransferase [Ferruginibacter sp.]|nr:acyltransferase [Ferruginibacter sp.]
MNRYKNVPFFEGLNALRFFAAFLVVMHHSEGIRKKDGLPNLEWLSLFNNGNIAVTFFFVLSGFLITYLLLKETNNTGTIQIKRFYVKRVLRIWPLYFLLVIIGTLILPVAFHVLHINYEMPYTFGQVWYYFLFFLPALVTFFFGHHFLEFLWSIGIEECFYLIWAPLLKFFKTRILLILLSVITIKVLLMVACFFIKNELFNYLVNVFSFEAMAIGGLGAWLVFNRQNPLSDLFVYKKPMQVIVYLSLAVYLIFNNNIHNTIWNLVFDTPIVSRLLVDMLFLYLIIGVSLIDTTIVTFQSKFLSYLGEISYGIYMYHMLVLFAIIQFLKKDLAVLNPAVSIALFYIIITVGVIAIAAISKVVFENYFLRLGAKTDRITEPKPASVIGA